MRLKLTAFRNMFYDSWWGAYLREREFKKLSEQEWDTSKFVKLSSYPKKKDNIDMLLRNIRNELESVCRQIENLEYSIDHLEHELAKEKK